MLTVVNEPDTHPSPKQSDSDLMPHNTEVLITMAIADELIAKLREISPQLSFTVIPASKIDDIPKDVWERVEVLYTNRVIPSPEQAPTLRWVQFHWAGVDHALDEPLLRKPGLAATTLSGAAASQIAEYVVTMILTLGHRLPDMMAHQKNADWPRDRWERFSPLELRNSTVGIVGYGSIGRQVARLLQPFGAAILATKKNAMNPKDSGYIPEGMGDPNGDLVLRLYPPEALCSMIKECDFLVITVPKTGDTLHLIGAEEIAALKPTAFLIDVSRGGIVDHKALIPALKENRIGGAALDVYPEEPLPKESPLWKLPDVVLTPHISGNTLYYDQRAMELFAENLVRYLNDLPLFNLIEVERGY